MDPAVCLSECYWLLRTMAEKFDLDTFVEHPTVEQVYSCRKDDLVEIAILFNIPFIRSMLKK